MPSTCGIVAKLAVQEFGKPKSTWLNVRDLETQLGRAPGPLQRPAVLNESVPARKSHAKCDLCALFAAQLAALRHDELSVRTRTTLRGDKQLHREMTAYERGELDESSVEAAQDAATKEEESKRWKQ